MSLSPSFHLRYITPKVISLCALPTILPVWKAVKPRLRSRRERKTETCLLSIFALADNWSGSCNSYSTVAATSRSSKTGRHVFSVTWLTGGTVGLWASQTIDQLAKVAPNRAASTYTSSQDFHVGVLRIVDDFSLSLACTLSLLPSIVLAMDRLHPLRLRPHLRHLLHPLPRPLLPQHPPVSFSDPNSHWARRLLVDTIWLMWCTMTGLLSRTQHSAKMRFPDSFPIRGNWRQRVVASTSAQQGIQRHYNSSAAAKNSYTTSENQIQARGLKIAASRRDLRMTPTARSQILIAHSCAISAILPLPWTLAAPQTSTRVLSVLSQPRRTFACGRLQRYREVYGLWTISSVLHTYCSKACQTAHWPKHKHDCKSPYLKSSWTTNWALQGRTPDFITDSDPGHEAPGFGHTLHYVWGNLPAMDCLNAANNERDSVSTKNLNLAFVASGDLRNVMATVNALPADYNGRCNILMNDLDTTVAGRNAALLFILLSDSGLELEEAAELCLHLQYSAALTREQAAQAFSCLATLFSNSLSHPTRQTCFKEIPLRGGGTLHLSFAETSIILDMIASRYPLSEAIRNMHAIVLAPTRKDYLDRYLFALRGPHRLGDMHLRKTGVLLPFGVSTSEFTEPNRLLFTSEGRWLSLDSASQLSGWDPRQ
ncbi:hypothetical protein BC835DRAFT_1311141, partial [Cytidiella melzeri]